MQNLTLPSDLGTSMQGEFHSVILGSMILFCRIWIGMALGFLVNAHIIVNM